MKNGQKMSTDKSPDKETEMALIILKDAQLHWWEKCKSKLHWEASNMFT